MAANPAVEGDNCGSPWNQSFSAGVFGNLSKSGSVTFAPTYNLSNRVSGLGSYVPTYDADGNNTWDTVNTYNWDSDGNMIKAVTSSATTNVTYDAMDRAVEFEVGSAYTQIVYGPGGGKLAYMSAQTLGKAYVPLAAGAVAVYNSSGLDYYRHSDWLGSSRLASTPSRGIQYDGAYAPYGENYAESGTTDHRFAGMDQAMVSSGSYPLYDALMREYHPTWGRWISPDPAGLAAVNPANPQTWNRYAYVGSNPLSFVDPLGLFTNQCNGTVIDGVCYNNGPPPPINPCDAGMQAPQCGNMPPCTGYGCPSSYPTPSSGGNPGGSSVGAATGNPQSLPKGQVNCKTALPNGQTVGDVVQQERASLLGVEAGLNASPGGSALAPVVLTAEFAYIARPNGPIDFKNMFKGQANPVLLGEAGNFAYYAIGSNILPTFELNAGATAYAIAAHGLLSSPDAQAVRAAALAAGGC